MFNLFGDTRARDSPARLRESSINLTNSTTASRAFLALPRCDPLQRRLCPATAVSNHGGALSNAALPLELRRAKAGQIAFTGMARSKKAGALPSDW
ncbi:MAG: hypothetical protein DME54_00230 [Verrucomicrobia bacterium]|nr:MAG: hypothetical protein DME54_00230 [Verrucomicrobiota bacterium]